MEPLKRLEDLPDEIVIEILSYLSCEDLVCVQHVSPQLRELSRATRLWMNLAYRPEEEVDDRHLISVFKQAPKLQALSIDKRQVDLRVIETLMENCTNITELHFHKHQKLSSKILQILLTKHPNIRILTIPEHVLYELNNAKIMAQFHNLVTLNISHDLHSIYLPILLKPLAEGCSRLKHLNLRYVSYRIADLQCLLHSKKDQLVMLGMNCCSEEGVCIVPQLLVCKALEELTINFICEPEIIDGFVSLHHLNNLTCLTLNQLNGVDVNQVIHFFEDGNMNQLLSLDIRRYDNYDDKLACVIIKNCQQLEFLKFDHCNHLTDESLKYMYTLQDLHSLTLDSAHITDNGVDYLSKCQNLAYLYMGSCCRLTGQCMSLVKNFTSLKILELDYCRNIDVEALERLKGEMSHISVNYSLLELV